MLNSIANFMVLCYPDLKYHSWDYNQLVYDRNLYFGLGPIPKPKPKFTNTFGQYQILLNFCSKKLVNIPELDN